ncbi:MAG: siderophore-interacting protein [Corynebacterium variabile]|uniref:siderophore-interacting protein n=1 Tax=Corynebacterium variabile TaxID=1727 RepID=UPI003F8EE978
MSPTDSAPSATPDAKPDAKPDAATVASVLNSPQHRSGLHDLTLEVSEIRQRFPWLVRVTGTVEGMRDTPRDAWSHPNLALRMAIPDADDEIGEMLGQAGLCRRVYTVADHDLEHCTVDIDIVVHGDSSPMMRWLAGLAPGSRVEFAGPRPHAAPTDVPDGGRAHLIADGSAYPAAAAIARSVAVATVTLHLPGLSRKDMTPQDTLQVLRDYAGDFPGAELRLADADSNPLTQAARSLTVGSSDMVWACGEREDIRGVRALLLRERNLPKAQVQAFGYWRRGKTGTQVDMARLSAVDRLQKEDRALTLDNDFDIGI